MGLDEIESAPTGRAICKRCKSRIRQKTPRGVMGEVDSYNRAVIYFICHKCVLEEINKEIEKQKNFKKVLKRITKENMKEVILMELERNDK